MTAAGTESLRIQRYPSPMEPPQVCDPVHEEFTPCCGILLQPIHACLRSTMLLTKCTEWTTPKVHLEMH